MPNLEGLSYREYLELLKSNAERAKKVKTADEADLQKLRDIGDAIFDSLEEKLKADRLQKREEANEILKNQQMPDSGDFQDVVLEDSSDIFSRIDKVKEIFEASNTRLENAKQAVTDSREDLDRLFELFSETVSISTLRREIIDDKGYYRASLVYREGLMSGKILQQLEELLEPLIAKELKPETKKKPRKNWWRFRF